MESWYLFLEVLIAISSVIGNGFALWILFVTPRLQTITNHFIASLAFADFLVGLLGIPFAILTSLGLPENFRGCLIMLTFLLWLCGTSTFSLIGVTLERYVAVLCPLRYPSLVTVNKTYVVIAISWAGAAIIGFLPAFGWNLGWNSDMPKCFFMDVIDTRYMVFNGAMVIYLPFMVMLVIYAIIFKAIRSQVRRIRPGVAVPSVSRTGIEQPSVPSTSTSVLSSSLKQEIRAAKSLGIIVVFFMLSWLPLTVMNTVFALHPSSAASFPPMLLKFFILLSHANSAGNPLLYAYGKDFRNAYKKKLHELFPCLSDALKPSSRSVSDEVQSAQVISPITLDKKTSQNPSIIA
ncbi:adenosine receptor A2b-like [Anneissia japonica]|uniref:adenosine receptor A2b-like n=1 Tax=Anneissia japonica TaxID=1529436 RepID=UPI00142553EF|nr:adenosine receptor A2b-like [Anneissia japonica]XP_033111579.1 adenosine receptor A2b-like [Anneissia japonica]